MFGCSSAAAWVPSPPEARPAVGVDPDSRGQDLQRDQPGERAAGGPGNDRHPAPAEQRLDLEVADDALAGAQEAAPAASHGTKASVPRNGSVPAVAPPWTLDDERSPTVAAARLETAGTARAAEGSAGAGAAATRWAAGGLQRAGPATWIPIARRPRATRPRRTLLPAAARARAVGTRARGLSVARPGGGGNSLSPKRTSVSRARPGVVLHPALLDAPHCSRPHAAPLCAAYFHLEGRQSPFTVRALPAPVSPPRRAARCSLASPARAETSTFTATADTYSQEDAPTSNFGTSVRFSAQGGGAGFARRGFVRFDGLPRRTARR